MNMLITGGLGFIGINAARYFASIGCNVYILDNLSRKGSLYNYNQIQETNPEITVLVKDIRNYNDMSILFKKFKFDAVLHLAAQVAVTTSIENPVEDFEINCLGTFNLLECCRVYSPECIFLYTSTNKVYGEFDIKLYETDKRYRAQSFDSITEEQSLDFHSPYGCSKGCGDQYVIDYSRIYGIRGVSLRQSCIFGTNQLGIEDQGWVSWFAIASIFNKPITIYGNGKQVRDVLYIDDLLELYNSIIVNIDKCSGNGYNVGGGRENTLSLLELIDILSVKLNKEIVYQISDWRSGDQKIYVSNIQKIKDDALWAPRTSISHGIDQMLDWTKNNKDILKKIGII